MKKTLSETQAPLLAPSSELSPKTLARLGAAANTPDARINLSDPDAPEVMDWTGAIRGKFYRLTKVLKSLRIDADVIAYFQAAGPGYQTRINRVLRASMLRGLRRRQAGPFAP